MFINQTTLTLPSPRGIFLALAMPILLIKVGVGCAEIKTSEGLDPMAWGVSVYALSRGKGVPDEARQVLDQARQELKNGQEQGEVTRLIERRIGLEGETRLCAEFVNEAVAERFFLQLNQLSYGVELVNIHRGMCPP
jgi:hypothetical protein